MQGGPAPVLVVMPVKHTGQRLQDFSFAHCMVLPLKLVNPQGDVGTRRSDMERVAQRWWDLTLPVLKTLLRKPGHAPVRQSPTNSEQHPAVRASMASLHAAKLMARGFSEQHNMLRHKGSKVNDTWRTSLPEVCSGAPAQRLRQARWRSVAGRWALHMGPAHFGIGCSRGCAAPRPGT